MTRHDWVFPTDRRAHAAELIYATAGELIARDGFDAFTIDRLAAKVHCSRATVYRYAGGRTHIREVVMARSAARIVDVVRRSVEGLEGPQRVLTAIEVAVAEIRADPAGQLFLESASGVRGNRWLTASPAIAELANELTGLAADDTAAKWITRLTFSLLFWPDTDPDAEHELLVRFVAPAFTADAGRA